MKKNILFLGTLFLFLSAQAQYCIPSVVDYGANTPGITFFSCGTFMHSSPTLENYINTGLSFSLQKGQSYSISISYTKDALECNEMSVRVWLDYNQNEVLDDALETILQFDNQTQVAVQGTFTVPQSAADGTTRMRIAVKMTTGCGYLPMEPCNNPPDPLEWHGEIEDYDVNIGGVGIESTQPLVADFSFQPNPVADELQVSYSLLTEANISLSICDITGKQFFILANEQNMSAGNHSFQLPINDMNLCSGVYFIQLNVNGAVLQKPFVVSMQ